mgnify:FL=1
MDLTKEIRELKEHILLMDRKFTYLQQQINDLDIALFRHMSNSSQHNFPYTPPVIPKEVLDEFSDDEEYGEITGRSVLSHDRTSTRRYRVHNPTGAKGDRGSEDGSPSF